MGVQTLWEMMGVQGLFIVDVQDLSVDLIMDVQGFSNVSREKEVEVVAGKVDGAAAFHQAFD